MYCMTVTYPIGGSTQFDMEYYRSAHMPLCASLFTDYGYRGAVLRVNEGSAPGKGGLNYVCVDLTFETAELMGAALATHGKEINADIANYTNAIPKITFSTIEVDMD